MVVAIHRQLGSAVPHVQRGAGNDGNGMTICIVVVEIDVFQSGFLFLTHVAVQGASANDIQQLRPAANPEDRQLFSERGTDEPDLNFIFQRMRLLHMPIIGGSCLVAEWLDVLAFDDQQAAHVGHIVRKARECAFNDRNDHR